MLYALNLYRMMCVDYFSVKLRRKRELHPHSDKTEAGDLEGHFRAQQWLAVHPLDELLQPCPISQLICFESYFRRI